VIHEYYRHIETPLMNVLHHLSFYLEGCICVMKEEVRFDGFRRVPDKCEKFARRRVRTKAVFDTCRLFSCQMPFERISHVESNVKRLTKLLTSSCQYLQKLCLLFFSL